MVSIWPYFEIPKERIRNLDSHNASCFLKKNRGSTRDFIRKVKSLHYATIKKYQSSGITVGITKNFGLVFKHIKVNAQILLFLLNSM